MPYVRSMENVENYEKLPKNGHFLGETLFFCIFLNKQINKKCMPNLGNYRMYHIF